MLTESQEKFLQTIPDSKITEIKPWDKKANDTALQLIEKIKVAVPELEIFYGGALALGIAGQNDIDITIKCPLANFEKSLPILENILGKPSKVSKRNIRWEPIYINGCETEVYMTDPNSPELQEQMRTFEILKNDKELRIAYEKLKQECNGIPYREYQRKKYEFYNKLLDK